MDAASTDPRLSGVLKSGEWTRWEIDHEDAVPSGRRPRVRATYIGTMQASLRSASKPSEAGRPLRLARQAFAALGVISAGVMAAASILWIFWHGPDLLGDAGFGLITEQAFPLGPGEWLVIGALTLVCSVVIAFCLKHAGPGAGVLAISWLPPAVIAYAYAASLPDLRDIGQLMSQGPEWDIRWPQLALGMQLATVTVFLFWKSFSVASTRRPQAVALAIGGLALIPAVWALIVLGLVWFNPN